MEQRLESSLDAKELTDSEEVFKAALTQTSILVGAALAFCAGVFLVQGQEPATAWFAAYILEESLSIDNLFVFSLIFDYFQTPLNAQPRVLKWGLVVAVVLRAAFIFGGLAIVEQFKGVLLVFAGILLYSSYQLFFEDEDEEEDLSQNAVVQLTKKYLPSTDEYDGEKFITAAPGSAGDGGVAGLLDGTSVVTPLLLALIVVEISDVLFAVDSIPAVFGVTTDPFIAFTSNGFAILGLRALYTIVAQAVNDFKYLRPSIALVLGFIGAKLIGEFAGVEISTTASLAVVATTLGGGVGASILLKDDADADKGDGA